MGDYNVKDRDGRTDEFFGRILDNGEDKREKVLLYGEFADTEENLPETEPEPVKEPDNSQRNDTIPFWAFCVGVIIMAALAVLCGIFIGRIIERNRKSSVAVSGSYISGSASEAEISKLNDAYNFILENFYEELDPDELLEGAIKGMVDSLDDPYSNYWKKETYESYENQLEGVSCGIGVTVDFLQDRLEVQSVVSGSAANKAGIATGDIITKINGKNISEMTQLEVQTATGTLDTEIVLTLTQADGSEKTVTCITETYKVETVSWQDLGEGIKHIIIDRFSTGTADEFTAALKEALETETAGIIIDLRGNPGGYVSEATAVADIILHEGIIAYSKDKTGKIVTQYESDENGLDCPLAVLVNGNTASAAELLTGAVKDLNEGIIVGTKTYGKAHAQILKSFESDGSGMVLTAYTYYTPSGACIHGAGIEPDVPVEIGSEYAGAAAKNIPFEADTQLKKAISLLTEQT